MMPAGYQSLTEKEKQTLRLIVRGHDAKSIARHLDLSVHTINERLRFARRKLAVSSSREAARLLLETEGNAPYSLGDEDLGHAATARGPDDDGVPRTPERRAPRTALGIAGAVIMSLFLGIVALATLSQQASPPGWASAAAVSSAEAATERSARDWLAIVDAGRWEESWRATAEAFRSLNTATAWADASVEARTPLGEVRSREAIAHESVPAPPHGYALVRFRTSFANRAQAVETVTLSREDEAWKVVGYYIE